MTKLKTGDERDKIIYAKGYARAMGNLIYSNNQPSNDQCALMLKALNDDKVAAESFVKTLVSRRVNTQSSGEQELIKILFSPTDSVTIIAERKRLLENAKEIKTYDSDSSYILRAARDNLVRENRKSENGFMGFLWKAYYKFRTFFNLDNAIDSLTQQAQSLTSMGILSSNPVKSAPQETKPITLPTAPSPSATPAVSAMAAVAEDPAGDVAPKPKTALPPAASASSSQQPGRRIK